MTGRDDGFRIADVDTSLMSDPKIGRLARRTKDPTRTAVAVALYEALILASWGEGQRVTLDDATPAWFTEPVDSALEDLQAVDLIDSDGRLKSATWELWFRPAFDRRERLRALGSTGGKAKRDGLADARANGLAHGLADALPNALANTVRPSDRPSISTRARAGGTAPPGPDEAKLFDPQSMTTEQYDAEMKRRFEKQFGTPAEPEPKP